MEMVKIEEVYKAVFSKNTDVIHDGPLTLTKLKIPHYFDFNRIRSLQ
jgi:hypothetical protein